MLIIFQSHLPVSPAGGSVHSGGLEAHSPYTVQGIQLARAPLGPQPLGKRPLWCCVAEPRRSMARGKRVACEPGGPTRMLGGPDGCREVVLRSQETSRPFFTCDRSFSNTPPSRVTSHCPTGHRYASQGHLTVFSTCGKEAAEQGRTRVAF